MKLTVQISSIILCLFFLSPIHAQISYSANQYASIGDTFLLSSASFGVQVFDFSVTGSGYNWDYAALPVESQETLRFIDPDTAGYFLTFFTACVLSGNFPWTCNDIWNDNTNLALADPDSLLIGGLEFSNSVSHLKKDNSVLRETMLGIRFGNGGVGLPLLIEYDQIDTVYRFPLNYQDADSSYRAYSIDLTQAGVDFIYLARQQRFNEIEGWGSLQTPYDSFSSVLKVKTTLINNDTLLFNGDTLSLGGTETVIYRWFDPAWAYPVLEAEGPVLGGLELINEVRYIDSLTCLEPNPLYFTTPLFPIYDNAAMEAEVTFHNTSTNADQFSWDFGDGNSSSSHSPVHSYNSPGIYTVQLIACNTICDPIWCDTLSFPLIVADTTSGSGPVNANFFVSPLISRCVGDSLTFNNLSLNATTFDWDFGDGNSSNLENPTHVYNSPGSYTIQLIASNMSQADTSVRIIDVEELQISLGADTTITTSEMLVLDPGAGDLFEWSDGSTGATLTIDGSQFAAGTYTFWVEAMEFAGCSARDSIVVIITNSSGIVQLNANQQIRIFPNPAQDKITVQFDGFDLPFQAVNIQLIDMLGRRLLSREYPDLQRKSIEIDHLSSGIYQLKVEWNRNQVFIPFQKE